MSRAVLNEPKQLVCDFCGSDFETVAKKNVRFCGTKCYQNSDKRKRAYNVPHRMKELSNSAGHRAKRKGIPHNINGDHLLGLWDSNGGKCCITGVPFDLSYGEKLQRGWSKANAPSLDRIVPELGYIKGNVRLVTFQVNCAMGAYPDEQFYEMCRKALEMK